jgi:fibronectin-binding autotransporter adhesin
LQGINVFEGGVTINAGTLTVANSTTAANQLGAAAVTFGGGSLISTKADATAAVQTYTVANLTANTSSLVTLSTVTGASQTFNLVTTTGVITRNAASTVGFVLSGAGTNVVNVGSANTIGNWATITSSGVTYFATKNGSNVLTAVTTSATDAVGSWTNANITDSAGFTGTSAAGAAIISLRFNAAAASTVTIGSGNGLAIGGANAGGILVTGNVAANTASVTGGSVYSLGNELIVHQLNSGANFTISSAVVNSGSTGTVLTKAGVGTLVLSGSNNQGFSGGLSLNEGTVRVSGGSALNDVGTVTLANKLNAILDLNNGSETIGSLAGGGFLGSTLGAGVVAGSVTAGGTVSIGSGTLTINQTANTTYSGNLTGSGALVVTGTALGNTLTLNTASNSFTGTLTINRAQLALANGSLTTSAVFANLPSVGAITLSNGGGLNIDNSGVNFSIDRINAASAITLLNTGANAAVATVGLNYTSDQGNLLAPRVQNVGAVTLAGGANTIRVNASGTTALAQLLSLIHI